jgi:hypothetical protein
MMIKSTIRFYAIISFIIIISTNMGFAQGYYFGRNKVQYTKFKWQILKTEHFDIYFYPEMKDIAEKGAKFAEDSYTLLQSKFNHTITRRVPLIFYSSHMHFQQTNITPGFIPEGVGGFFEFLKGRVVIPSNGNLNQFKKVITHELVHVFMHSKVERVLKNKGRLNTGTYPPLWFTEGLAEFWSSSWDSQAEMVIKDAVLFDYIVGLQDMWSIEGTFMMYKEGQHILGYIAAQYGEEKLLLLLENLWKHPTFQSCFYETIGLSYAEFDDQYLYHLKKKYYPLLQDNDLSSKISSTIVREGYNFKPAFYEQDHQPFVIFTANRTGYSSIYSCALLPLRIKEKEKSKILIRGEKSSDFEAFHLLSSKIDVNREGVLVFGSKSGENDALYLFAVKTKKIIAKYQFDNMVGILSPAWSENGKKIVFSGLSFSGNSDLYIFDTATQELTQLTNDFYDDIEPSWSPDGQFIVFSSDRTDTGKQWAYNIFILNISTGEISYVTYGQQKDLAPVFSPDGKYIAFTSDRDLSINIYLAEIDQEYHPRAYYKLTNFANAAYDPEWTSDGGLLFGVYEDRRFQIRYLPEAIQKKNTVAALPLTNINKSSKPWSFENLSINQQLGQLNYKKDYDLDIVQSQVTQDPIFGTSGGAQFAFTDLLGNDQYHILIYNNARTSQDFLKSFNFALTKVSLEKRTNYALGIFRYAGRYFNYDESFYYEDRVGAFLSLSYPLSQFTRFQYSTSLSYLDKERYGDSRFFSYLFSNYINFVKDNSLWTNVGPIDGHRLSMTLGKTFDLRNSNISYYTIIADYRHYFRLSLRSAFAVRFLFLRNQGREARRFYFGGSWDMRGVANWSLRSNQILFMSNELRFPFIDRLGIGLPFGTVGFSSIRSSLFFDVCSLGSFDVQNLNQSALGSFGFGFRMTPIPYLVLRLDIGKTTDFSRVSDRFFTQFFFGWDF